MALPLKERPLCFRLSSEIYLAVFESVGTASMCWEPRPTGVFEMRFAEKVAADLCFKIADGMDALMSERDELKKLLAPVLGKSEGESLRYTNHRLRKENEELKAQIEELRPPAEKTQQHPQ